ncbi:hypothetical protein [Ulvibacter litoralis]|uniref:Uncharacterized protein n=1 Tax=Ulvibacter litoralis TaxID=227084 RepID=A0A1G7H3D5_9FLAO|nr:hypothetical protein [Ulvibacter litoralis]GHC59011.1 hypothetical protein GCM10008083_24680 [Ulvibacter litoralis]SDE94932.1 hypothetical protein SAMN05421855_103504 [Ulvibacter litoralis]
MKAKKTYLKGQSVFIVSLLVIGITFFTVYLTGVNYNRSVTSNLYLSLGIIGTVLFLFMTYGLYKGIGLIDNFPKFRAFKSGEFIPSSGEIPEIDVPSISSDDGISGIIISILLWIGMAILFIILLFLLEAFFWISIFIILAMLYWVFFRALRLVFSKSKQTVDDIGVSAMYSITYTVLYLGWIFGIVFLIETFR